MEQTQIRAYGEIENDLTNVLNSKHEDNTERFKAILSEFKNAYGVEVTTKFLRNLTHGDNKQKSKRVYYLLKQANLKTDVILRHLKEWTIQKWHTEKTAYEPAKDFYVTDKVTQKIPMANNLIGFNCLENQAVFYKAHNLNIHTEKISVGKAFICRKIEVLYKVIL